MTRENAEAKGRRYVAEGRLAVVYVSGPMIRATCRGDGEVYRLGHDSARGRFCHCPALTRGCCHLVALRLVCLRPRLDQAVPPGPAAGPMTRRTA
jgi:uncharacterized Zn finger protein